MGNGKQRPTEFSGGKDLNQILFVLQRAKPGEEKLKPEEIAQLKDPIAKIREAVARSQSQNNLKQIGLAFHNYHDQHKALPAHAIYDKDGKKALLSWRVAILPYIEQGPLYNEFKLDEPWDSDHNKKLIAKMPKTYEPLGDGKKEKGMTYYQVITGKDTIFDGPKQLRIPDITDGTANTLLVIEAKDPVTWSKPDDLTFPKQKGKAPAIGGLFKSGTNALMCDGSVRMLAPKISPELLRAIITPAGGEDLDKLDK
jgi:prepilin-type processing-associated H-X9-DG protein